MKSFVIVGKDKERVRYVNEIVKLTNALVVDAVWCPIFPVLGCLLSHINVARMGEGGYMVFEDDCHIKDHRFMVYPCDADIVYYGINGTADQERPIPCKHYWGTHAMYVSEKARRCLLACWEAELEQVYPKGFPAMDEIWSVLIARHGLTFTIHDCIEQQKGLRSSISGNIR